MLTEYWFQKTDQYVDVKVKPRIPIEVSMKPTDLGIAKSFLDQLHEDLFLTVQLFEEEIRKTTLHFAFIARARRGSYFTLRLSLFSSGTLLNS